MPSPSSTATVNTTLTNFAVGIAPNMISSLADFIAPRVSVGLNSAQYKEYDSKDAFIIYRTARGHGGKANRIEFNADDKTFNCKPRALEIPIDDDERDRAGENQLQLEQAKTRTLLGNTFRSHEKDIFDVVGAVSAEATIGKWNDPNVDPIDEIDGVIDGIATDTSMMPNAAVIGLGFWRIAKNHPKVLKRFPGAAAVGVSLQQFASLLLNPAIDLRVGIMSYDTTNIGVTASKTNIVGANMFVFIRSENPDQYDPSWAKTFMATRLGFANVRQYRDESCRSDILSTDWADAPTVTSSISGRKIVLR